METNVERQLQTFKEATDWLDVSADFESGIEATFHSMVPFISDYISI